MLRYNWKRCFWSQGDFRVPFFCGRAFLISILGDNGCPMFYRFNEKLGLLIFVTN